VTSDIAQRVWEHKNSEIKDFTKKYGCHHLVYFEQCGDMITAIEREKQIKAGSRKKKLTLGAVLARSEATWQTNPDWLDLYDTW
jgi:putative endonuclease